MMCYHDNLSFVNSPKFYMNIIMPRVMTQVSKEKYGFRIVPIFQILKGDIHIYPADVFSSLYDFATLGKERNDATIQYFEDKSLFLPMISRTTYLHISALGMYYYIREHSITTSIFTLDKYIDAFKSEIDVFNGICAAPKTLPLDKYKRIHYLKAVRYAQAIGMMRKEYVKQWVQSNDEIALTLGNIGICPINKDWFRLIACWIVGFVRYCQMTTWLLRQKKKNKELKK